MRAYSVLIQLVSILEEVTREAVEVTGITVFTKLSERRCSLTMLCCGSEGDLLSTSRVRIPFERVYSAGTRPEGCSSCLDAVLRRMGFGMISFVSDCW